MGASGWSYFVPYQPDINKAFQELRQQLFEKGDYYKSWEGEYESGPLDETISRLSKEEQENLFEGLDKPEPPKTIEELIEMSETAGTHTIIDMEGVYLEPVPEGEEGAFGTIYPFPAEDLLEIFGTARPTRDMIELVEKEEEGLLDEYALGSWTGLYITYYKGDTPDGYFFTGYSGD